VGVVLHVPEVAELVVGPRGGAARPRRLHREAAHHQTDDQPPEAGWIAPGNQAGRVNPGGEEILHGGPGRRIDRLFPRGVGQDPVGPGDALGEQVGVSRRVHPRRGEGDHVEVSQHGPGGGTAESLLGSPIGDRRPKGRIAVHRGRGRDRHVGPAQAMSGKFGQVVDRPGPNGHRGGPGRPEGRLQRLAASLRAPGSTTRNRVSRAACKARSKSVSSSADRAEPMRPASSLE